MAARKAQPITGAIVAAADETLGKVGRWSSRRPEPWRRALLASLPALAFLLGCFPVADFDVWWHLRTGQLILETHTVPRLDLFTYTNATRPWIDVYWLYQVGLALLYRAGGASALVLLKATAGAGIVALSMLGRRPGHRAWPLALAWLPGVLMVSGRLSERPEAASLLLLTAYPGAAGARRAGTARALAGADPSGVVGQLPRVLRARSAGAPGVRDGMGGRAAATTSGATALLVHRRAPSSPSLSCPCSPAWSARTGPKPFTLPFEQFHTLGSAALYRAAIGELKTAGDFIAVAGHLEPLSAGLLRQLSPGPGQLRPLRAPRRGAPVSGADLRRGRLPGLAGHTQRRPCGVIAVLVTTWNLDDALAARPLADPAPTKKSRGRRAPAGPRKVATASKDAKTSAPAVGPHRTPCCSSPSARSDWPPSSGALYAWSGEGRRVGFGERPRWFAHDACAFLARPDLPERIAAYNISQAAVCIAHGAPQHKQFMDPRLEVNTAGDLRTLPGRDPPAVEQRHQLGERPGDRLRPARRNPRHPDRARAAGARGRDSEPRSALALRLRRPLATVFVTTRFAEQHHLPPVPLR